MEVAVEVCAIKNNARIYVPDRQSDSPLIDTLRSESLNFGLLIWKYVGSPL